MLLPDQQELLLLIFAIYWYFVRSSSSKIFSSNYACELVTDSFKLERETWWLQILSALHRFWSRNILPNRTGWLEVPWRGLKLFSKNLQISSRKTLFASMWRQISAGILLLEKYRCFWQAFRSEMESTCLDLIWYLAHLLSCGKICNLDE